MSEKSRERERQRAEKYGRKLVYSEDARQEARSSVSEAVPMPPRIDHTLSLAMLVVMLGCGSK